MNFHHLCSDIVVTSRAMIRDDFSSFVARLGDLLRAKPIGTTADLTATAIAYWDGEHIVGAFLSDDGSGRLNEEYELEFAWESWHDDMTRWLACPRFTKRKELMEWLVRRLGSKAAEPQERRALLLHLGDVLDTVHYLTRLPPDYVSLADAIASEGAIPDYPILRHVASDMTPSVFVQKVIGAFFLWPEELLAEELNRHLLAQVVQHDLFAGNQSGWDAYCVDLRKDVPWFGLGLPPVAQLLPHYRHDSDHAPHNVPQ
jgi:hypothetical protein